MIILYCQHIIQYLSTAYYFYNLRFIILQITINSAKIRNIKTQEQKNIKTNFKNTRVEPVQFYAKKI